ncbi:MAG: 23S rRNA (adenine(1618)-N(6))-methyltransferase RlmF [Sphingobacteriales bacterium]|jgi:23S rRNA (adenine1618-N6)-methyltransferase|nr:23S rRNA (adenine(1618)-N(6))-methyltransferase RlmF [Sphingobacteriales bacterium]
MEKNSLHTRNRHRDLYDFKALIASYKPLREFVFQNEFDVISIDFFNPEAVIALNKALLKCYYNIDFWEIPTGYLCPPIPGRADYIHYAADLFGENNTKLKCLDIGVGANCVYPIIGVQEYQWKFVGSEIESIAVKSAKAIVENNPVLQKTVDIRHQKHPLDIFKGIIQTKEKFDLVICNPPFFGSAAEAAQGNIKKTSNLRGELVIKPRLNFGGKNSELWCPGGELKFVNDMIYQSKEFGKQIKWFTTLVSKKENLKKNYFHLEKLKALEVRTVEMKQGNKTSRMLAWTFQK